MKTPGGAERRTTASTRPNRVPGARPAFPTTSAPETVAEADEWADLDGEMATHDAPEEETAVAPVDAAVEPDDEWGDVDGELASAPALGVSLPVSAPAPVDGVHTAGSVDDWEEVTGDWEDDEGAEGLDEYGEVAGDRDLSGAGHEDGDTKVHAGEGRTRGGGAGLQQVALTDADYIVLRAACRLRFASASHIERFVIETGKALTPEDAEGMTSTEVVKTGLVPVGGTKVKRRLARLEKRGGYLQSFSQATANGHSPKLYVATALAFEVADPEAAGYLAPFRYTPEARAEVSMAHSALAASYVAWVGMRDLDFVPDAAIGGPAEAARKGDTAWRPAWDAETMDVWEDAAHLAVPMPFLPGKRDWHEPDLMAVDRATNAPVCGVEVELSRKTVEEYVRMFEGYRDAGLGVVYLVQNTLRDGAPSRKNVRALVRLLTRAAVRVHTDGGRRPMDWEASGVRILVADASWKGTDPDWGAVPEPLRD